MATMFFERAAAVLLAAACCIALPLHAADANYARNLAAGCANCHGTDGRSRAGMASLIGQDKSTLLRQLQDFRAGRRPATIMHQLAKGYTDEQLDLVAGYFAGLKPAAAPAMPRGGY